MNDIGEMHGTTGVDGATVAAQDPIVRAMAERLVIDFSPLAVILFGSRARGDAHAASDVDLLVIVPPLRQTHELAGAMYDALADYPLPCDIVLTSPGVFAERRKLPFFVHHYADKEGRVLYGRP